MSPDIRGLEEVAVPAQTEEQILLSYTFLFNSGPEWVG